MSIVISLWIVDSYVTTASWIDPLTVSLHTLAVACTTLLVALIIWIFRRKKQSSIETSLLLTLLGVSMLLAIESTGNLSSPFISAWVVVALFGAAAGFASFVPSILLTAAYGAYLYMYHQLTMYDWTLYTLAIVLPVLLGCLIWSRRFKDQEKSNQAVTELAQELSKESTKSDIIINAIADGVILMDANGIIKLINPAAQRIIGWGSEDATELDYRSVLKIINSKDDIIEGDLDPVQRCLMTHESIITDKLGIRTVSGKQLLASILVSPLEQSGAGAIVVFRDITAQRAEERDQAEFISTASHEMRTPVAAIEGYLGLALNPQTAVIDDKARLYLMKAHDSAKHLGRLFQDLLDISKFEDGRLKNQPITIEITNYVKTLLEDFTPQFTEKGLSIVFTPATSTAQTITPLYYANADPDHLHEILANLITNAIKYTKEGGVTVDVTGDDEHVYVSVIDTGMGIPQEDIPHLFQKFYRVDSTDTREIGGTGLGLYLSRRLSEAMGGHLNVSSTYGSGSTFTVDLPRVEAAAPAPKSNPENAESP